ncbi:MAG: OmpA family protein [Acidobacteriia bacterium]|nr:OmpA family protein [Terriglobia bacterium]
MRLDRKLKWLIVIAFVLSLMIAAGGCKKKPKVAPPPPPPPPAPAAPTAKISVDPSTITEGQSSTLSWNTTNATDVSIEPGVGKVNLEGSQTVSPSSSTTYTITAKGPGGTATDTARLGVGTKPAPAPTPPPAGPTAEELWDRNVKKILFDYDKADIRADQQSAVSNNAEFLKAHPTWRFSVEGNCDERGSIEYNLALGDRRANAVKTALVAAGVAADRIRTISYGKEKAHSCADEGCWQQDRNASFVLNQH